MSVDEDPQTADHVYVERALAGAKRDIEHLQVAVEHRTTIGQAQGILMAQLDIDAATAFEYLKRVSSHTNRKLIDIAEEIVRTRALPGSD